LEGTKKTAVIVAKAHPADEGKGIIRIDDLTRKNVGTGLGEKLICSKATTKSAKEVTLSPMFKNYEEIEFGTGFNNIVLKGLIKRPVKEEDRLIIPQITLFGTPIVFQVVKTNPESIVIIEEDTKILIQNKNITEEIQERTIKTEIKPVYEGYAKTGENYQFYGDCRMKDYFCCKYNIIDVKTKKEATTCVYINIEEAINIENLVLVEKTLRKPMSRTYCCGNIFLTCIVGDAPLLSIPSRGISIRFFGSDYRAFKEMIKKFLDEETILSDKQKKLRQELKKERENLKR
jgi:hypothetical protein